MLRSLFKRRDNGNDIPTNPNTPSGSSQIKSGFNPIDFDHVTSPTTDILPSPSIQLNNDLSSSLSLPMGSQLDEMDAPLRSRMLQLHQWLHDIRVLQHRLASYCTVLTDVATAGISLSKAGLAITGDTTDITSLSAFQSFHQSLDLAVQSSLAPILPYNSRHQHDIHVTAIKAFHNQYHSLIPTAEHLDSGLSLFAPTAPWPSAHAAKQLSVYLDEWVDDISECQALIVEQHRCQRDLNAPMSTVNDLLLLKAEMSHEAEETAVVVDINTTNNNNNSNNSDVSLPGTDTNNTTGLASPASAFPAPVHWTIDQEDALRQAKQDLSRAAQALTTSESRAFKSWRKLDNICDRNDELFSHISRSISVLFDFITKGIASGVVFQNCTFNLSSSSSSLSSASPSIRARGASAVWLGPGSHPMAEHPSASAYKSRLRSSSMAADAPTTPMVRYLSTQHTPGKSSQSQFNRLFVTSPSNDLHLPPPADSSAASRYNSLYHDTSVMTVDEDGEQSALRHAMKLLEEEIQAKEDMRKELNRLQKIQQGLGGEDDDNDSDLSSEWSEEWNDDDDDGWEPTSGEFQDGFWADVASARSNNSNKIVEIDESVLSPTEESNRTTISVVSSAGIPPAPFIEGISTNIPPAPFIEGISTNIPPAPILDLGMGIPPPPILNGIPLAPALFPLTSKKVDVFAEYGVPAPIAAKPSRPLRRLHWDVIPIDRAMPLKEPPRIRAALSSLLIDGDDSGMGELTNMALHCVGADGKLEDSIWRRISTQESLLRKLYVDVEAGDVDATAVISEEDMSVIRPLPCSSECSLNSDDDDNSGSTIHAIDVDDDDTNTNTPQTVPICACKAEWLDAKALLLTETLKKTKEDAKWISALPGLPLPLNTSLIDSKFSNDVVAKKRAFVTNDTKESKLELLDPKRSYNISIALRGLRPLTGMTAVEAVLLLDDSQMTLDKVVRLTSLLPTTAEVEILKGYKGPLDQLAEPEQLLITIVRTPYFKEHLRVLHFSLEVDDVLSMARAQLSLVQAALTQLVTSTALQTFLLLVLRIGNYLNSGTKKGQAVAVSLNILSKLKSTKTADLKSNLLMHIVEYGMKNVPSILALPEQLSEAHNASRVDRVALKADVSSLELNLALVKQLQGIYSANANSNSHVLEVLSSFISQVEDDVVETCSKWNDTITMLENTAVFLGEPDLCTDWSSLLTVFSQFSADVSNTVREIKERELRLQKFREKERNHHIKGMMSPLNNPDVNAYSNPNTPTNTPSISDEKIDGSEGLVCFGNIQTRLNNKLHNFLKTKSNESQSYQAWDE